MTEENRLLPPPKPAPKPGRVMVYRALKDYVAKTEEEISFNEGDLLYVSECDSNESWWNAKCGSQKGKVPSNYIASAQYVEFPLHDAAKRGNIEFIEDCLAKEVSPNSLDKSGSTALYWASHGGHTEVVKLLLSIPNISVSSQNKIGDTALHAAAWKAHADCVNLLLDCGANVFVRNREGKLPYDVASDDRCRSLLKIVMQKLPENCEEEKDYYSDSDTESDNIRDENGESFVK
ncbi:hypothetical protein AB6A40_007649 [Gnathostoma spinigerum]|uniref:Osteoclast-stimulating factor 1 n=1 Tax=Gnathostoma spinigerum TaxID=75299 RepID=A0ABD6EXE9_9BILA